MKWKSRETEIERGRAELDERTPLHLRFRNIIQEWLALMRKVKRAKRELYLEMHCYPDSVYLVL